MVLRLGRSFSSACQLGGGDEVGPFSKGQNGFSLSIRIKFSNNSRTPRDSFPRFQMIACVKKKHSSKSSTFAA